MSIYTKLENTASRITSYIKKLVMPDIEYFSFKESSQLPVFFLSHGGPTFADRSDPLGSNAGAWDATKKVGEYINDVLKPDFIIAVSAHWQTDVPDEIEIATPGPGEAFYTKNGINSNRISKDENALIYDFYNFPEKLYKSQFHTFPNKFIADDIVTTLNGSDWFQAKTTERGIDHGVFVPLKVAFADTNVADSQKWDVDVPLIQVSLAGTPDIEIHYRLGEVLAKYRSLNGVIIFSGMSVHNLGDLGFARSRNNQPLDYVAPFNNILTDILTETDNSKVLDELKRLPRDPEYKALYEKAHPTNEHLLPAVAAAGAGQGDLCTPIFVGASGSLGWNVYGWGDLANFK